MNKLIPAPLYRKANFVVYWLFGVTKKKEKELLKAIMDDADNDFVDWATNKIAKWDNEQQLTNVITIHGTADRVLPDLARARAVQRRGLVALTQRFLSRS